MYLRSIIASFFVFLIIFTVAAPSSAIYGGPLRNSIKLEGINSVVTSDVPATYGAYFEVSNDKESEVNMHYSIIAAYTNEVLLSGEVKPGEELEKVVDQWPGTYNRCWLKLSFEPKDSHTPNPICKGKGFIEGGF